MLPAFISEAFSRLAPSGLKSLLGDRDYASTRIETGSAPRAKARIEPRLRGDLDHDPYLDLDRRSTAFYTNENWDLQPTTTRIVDHDTDALSGRISDLNTRDTDASSLAHVPRAGSSYPLMDPSSRSAAYYLRSSFQGIVNLPGLRNLRLFPSPSLFQTTAHGRLAICFILISMLSLTCVWRLFELTHIAHSRAAAESLEARSIAVRPLRAPVLDRHGRPLALSVPIDSLYVDPSLVLDRGYLADQLAPLLKISRSTILNRASRRGRFVWLERHITADLKRAVEALSLPGLGFAKEYRRVYPFGADSSHLVGFTDIDGNGLAGLELAFDSYLSSGNSPLVLSIDAHLQSAVRSIVQEQIDYFSGLGGAAVVLHIPTGEVRSIVSLPDFNPAVPTASAPESRFNRATLGVYEPGSVFKTVTMAIGLEEDIIRTTDIYDIGRPLTFGRFRISDFKPKRGNMTVPDIFKHSSNIGTGKIALDIGPDLQKEYLVRLGMTTRMPHEIVEKGAPLTPDSWKKLASVTIGYGHGIAVTPLHVVSLLATVIGSGELVYPTVLDARHADLQGRSGLRKERVFSDETVRTMRAMLRLVSIDGTGAKGDVPGFQVGGKTGTADKVGGGRYRENARISSFAAAFPMSDPEYAVYVMVDEPKPRKETFGYATGGWVAAPAVRHIVESISRLQIQPPSRHVEIDDAVLGALDLPSLEK